jgi:hypothetical protein
MERKKISSFGHHGFVAVSSSGQPGNCMPRESPAGSTGRRLFWMKHCSSGHYDVVEPGVPIKLQYCKLMLFPIMSFITFYSSTSCCASTDC